MVRTWVGWRLGTRLTVAGLTLGALAVAALVGTVVQGSGKLGAAAIAVLPVALALYAVGGAGHGVKNVAARALIHDRVASDAHGRAFATYAALRNCAELAALVIGGVLVDTIGARGTLLVAGAATALIGLLGYATLAGTPDHAFRITRRITGRELRAAAPTTGASSSSRSSSAASTTSTSG